jgi:hypothetical protein
MLFGRELASRSSGVSPMIRCSSSTASLVVCLALGGISVRAAEPAEGPAAVPGVVHAVINGLAIDIDAKSGGILRLSLPGVGTILQSPPDKAGLLDAACPLADFEPFRLGSRFSTAAKVERSPDAVTITWERLGGSRPFELSGGVSAVVKISADPDGRSATLKCRIENKSPRAVPQVVFPDFHGLLPLPGRSETRIRSGGVVYAPFRDIKRPEDGRFYALAGASGEREASFKATYGGEMWMRWFDFGNLQSGLSCWERFWGNGPDDLPGAPLCGFRTELDEFENKVRIGWMHAPKIPPGGTWESREYVLTPHEGGWAKGIGPFRQWVEKSRKREFPLPDHVRKGLGFRSVFLCNWQPKDGDRDVIWRFSDLPKVAEEARRHGLTEMVAWFWHDHFQLPLPPALEHLGGEPELVKAVAECKKAGVNVALFVSVLDLANPSAARYGLKVRNAWSYHPELLPRIGASYANAHNTCVVDSGNEAWQEEVLAGCRRLAGEGLPSICWDVFNSRKEEPNLFTLARKIRTVARQKDRQSTFGAEVISNVELMSEAVDYTWNWTPAYVDYRAFTSVFDAPRLNVNVNHSVADASLCFMDNVYLNVMPCKTPYGVNGSGTIAQYAEFSKRLRQCAERREQFLDYFTAGTLIGECLLSQDCADAHVTSYLRPGKALLLILNRSDRRTVPFRCDLAGWIPSPTGRYRVEAFDMDGRRLKTFEAAGQWDDATGELEQNGIALFEITAK